MVSRYYIHSIPRDPIFSYRHDLKKSQVSCLEHGCPWSCGGPPWFSRSAPQPRHFSRPITGWWGRSPEALIVALTTLRSVSSLFNCSGTFWWLISGSGGRKSYIDGGLRLGLGQLEQPPRPDQFAFEDICFTRNVTNNG